MCFVLGLGCAQGQEAQPAPQQTAPASPQQTAPSSSSAGTSSSSQALDITETGRRITGGLTLSVLGFNLVPGSTSTVNNSSTVSTQAQTKGESPRIGYGLTGQVRITGHFAVDLSAVYRRIGYQFTNTIATTTTTVLNGTVNSTTATTDTHQDVHARLLYIPVVLRYYSGSRRPNGPRWFVEAGGAWLWASGIRTSTDTTDAAGVNTCCSFTPVSPAHNSAVGMVAGAGLQFIDAFGIHVVPEVRYTRWIDQVFNNSTTHTFQNQLEAVISLTY